MPTRTRSLPFRRPRDVVHSKSGACYDNKISGLLLIIRYDANITARTRRPDNLWLPKTPSELKMQWFRAFVRSWWYHDELSFCCPFRFGHLQFSIPYRPAGGDPRASSSTRGFPEECTAAFAPPALRPAFVGLAVTMVARWAPESTHRSPRYSDRLAP